MGDGTTSRQQRQEQLHPVFISGAEEQNKMLQNISRRIMEASMMNKQNEEDEEDQREKQPHDDDVHDEEEEENETNELLLRISKQLTIKMESSCRNSSNGSNNIIDTNQIKKQRQAKKRNSLNADCA